MKSCAFRLAVLFSLFINGTIVRSATLTWTNLAGGDWTVATNWSPNQVPVTGDDVLITNGGTYAITNANNLTLDSLSIGGTNGIQTLFINSLTLTNVSVVNSNGVLNWSGGYLNAPLTVALGGTLAISNTFYLAYPNYAVGTSNTVPLTNYGTVVWDGTIYSAGNAVNHQGGGIIYNAGLWQATSDTTMTVYNSVGTNYFINTGTLEKTGGSAASGINWTFLNNGGTVTTPMGSFNLADWEGTGTVHGTATFSGGTISGTLASGSVMNFSATINQSLTVASGAQANWYGGDVEGALTVMSGATLSISNAVQFALDNYQLGTSNTAVLTNYGTVNWAGTVYGSANSANQAGGGLIYNAGIWDALTDGSMTTYSGSGTNYFINAGTLEKTGGTGVSTINWSFSTTGTIDTPTGAFTLDWNGPSILNGNLSLANTTITSPLTVASNAVLNLSGDDIEGALTVAAGATLTLSNTIQFAYDNYSLGFSNTATLTNFGTVLCDTVVYGSGNSANNTGGGLIYNAGDWQSLSDSQFSSYDGRGTNVFINIGTLEKTGGTAATTISWGFDNPGGTVNTPVGYFSFGGDWYPQSIVYGQAVFAGNLSGTIGSNAVITWQNGDLEGYLTVAQGGTLTLTNTTQFAYNNYALGSSNYATLTNYGTVVSAGTVYASGNSVNHAGGGLIYNAGLWEAAGDNSMGTYNGVGTNYFINLGTLEKISGSSISSISWNVSNVGGIIGSQTNTLSLSGVYDLTGGTVNVGINAPGNSGKVNLGGSPAVLTGAFSANLNNGYIPATGSMFTALTYTSEGGTFTNFNLPFPDAWQTNYGASSFMLTVLNVRPVMETLTNQSVDELTLLTQTASATDQDAGQTRTFALVSPPAGMTINSNTGAISWTPAQTQSPGPNTIRVSVTDNGTPPLSATNSFVATVIEINVAPSLPNVSTQTVNELTLLTVTNAATNFNIHSSIIGYTLVGAPSNMVINAGGIITWTPAQTQSPGTNLITTIVTNSNPYDLVNPQLTSTNQFTVIVKEVNVAPSLPVISTQTLNELTLLTVTNFATNLNIHSSIIGYTLVGAPSNMVINASGIITWTPAQTQSPGTNVITTIVTNSNPYDLVNLQLTSTNQFSVIVKEVNVAPALPVIATQDVNELTLLTITNAATNSNIHSTNTGYALIGAPSNMVVSASGIITWTPAQAQSPGTNLITTVVTNNNPYDLVNAQLSTTNTFTVIVHEVNVAPVLPVISTQTVNAQALLTVTNTGTESNIHATLAYLLTAPTGASISPGGVITWTPSTSQGPSTNTFTTIVTNTDAFDTNNPHLSATNHFSVIVYEPTLAAISNYTVNVGQTVSFTASATDNDNTRTLMFSLDSAPATATIGAIGGAFSWRPPASSGGSSNLIQVRVTDNSVPALSATQSFYVLVNAFSPVTISPVSSTATNFQMQIAGPIGPDYILQALQPLGTTNWLNLRSNTPAVSPFTLTDTNAGLFTNRFYRVKLSP